MKLEEYKEQQIQLNEESFSPRDIGNKGACSASGYRKGFDTAIILDLAVKFERWKLEEGITYYNPNGKIGFPNSYFRSDNHSMDIETPEELYKYWIENIFKIE